MKQEINLTENQGVMVLYLTLGCNAGCRHCAFESGSEKLHLRLTPEEVTLAMHTAKESGIVAVELSGGEPFLALDLVELSLKQARQLGLSASIDTNASWARTPEAARNILTHLAELGLRDISVSYDRYHAEFVPPNCIVNACEQAERLGYRVRISMTEANDSLKHHTLTLLKPLERFVLEEHIYPHNLRPPARVGRGINLSDEELALGGLALLQCPQFEYHLPSISVFPKHLVSFCCCGVNPRLTYRYPVKENWLADMLEVWNNDECIKAMWHRGLAQISGPSHKLASEQPCGYCFELLPRLYPDKELIDIRALQ
jgi:organic radical activating enzyme